MATSLYNLTFSSYYIVIIFIQTAPYTYLAKNIGKLECVQQRFNLLTI